jgi:hypothetical protein
MSIHLLATFFVILVGFLVVIAGGDGPWWLLPLGLVPTPAALPRPGESGIDSGYRRRVLNARVGIGAALAAVAAYLAWTAAVSDQSDATAATALTGVVFYVCLVVAIACVLKLALDKLRSRR